jgi:hypothetical protein
VKCCFVRSCKFTLHTNKKIVCAATKRGGSIEMFVFLHEFEFVQQTILNANRRVAEQLNSNILGKFVCSEQTGGMHIHRKNLIVNYSIILYHSPKTVKYITHITGVSARNATSSKIFYRNFIAVLGRVRCD